MGREQELRADRVREKERKRTAQMDKANAAQCHSQMRAGVQVGPGTDGVRKTCSDSNPACEAWSNRTQGLGHDGNSSVSIYSRTNFSLLLSSVFLSSNIACVSLHMD